VGSPAVPLTETPLSSPTSPPEPTSEPTSPPPATVSTLPDPNAVSWNLVVSGVDQPIGLAFARDGSGRLFVLEKVGRIRIVQNDTLVPTAFLDITDRVGSSGSERGLLGLAFHPQYPENGLFYVNYTDANGDTVIARFQVSGDPNVADPGTEQVMIQVAQPFPNHNGGGMEFGPDGYLYLGLGDGGSGGDPFGNGQSTDTLLGKLLRIDVNNGDPYAIPADNPFAGGGGKAEIWAYGLRNPWRFSFDRQTGDLYIADVGQNQWEEIDFQPAGSPGGLNFGWNLREGRHDFQGGSSAGSELVDPVWEYSHSEGGCSVTGGEVYRGPSLPDWNGVYIYGDYCTGLVWGLLRQGDSWDGQLMFETPYRITSFGADEAGEVYLVDYSGDIYRLG